MFSFQPTDRVFSHKLWVFAFADYARFALLQSRAHAAWTWLLSSTFEERLNYSATDCFATFPFPKDGDMASLEPIGQALYESRARFMVATNDGLTETYNQLKDPACDCDGISEIKELRTLHEQVDRAVLAAYGWSDIAVPPFCPVADADRAAVSLFEDTVIDRLFALNAERAAAEAKAAGKHIPIEAKPKVSKPAKKSRTAKTQISMLDEE